MKTMREVQMQLSENTSRAIFDWLLENKNLVGREIELSARLPDGRIIKTFIAKITEYVPAYPTEFNGLELCSKCERTPGSIVNKIPCKKHDR